MYEDNHRRMRLVSQRKPLTEPSLWSRHMVALSACTSSLDALCQVGIPIYVLCEDLDPFNWPSRQWFINVTCWDSRDSPLFLRLSFSLAEKQMWAMIQLDRKSFVALLFWNSWLLNECSLGLAIYYVTPNSNSPSWISEQSHVLEFTFPALGLRWPSHP